MKSRSDHNRSLNIADSICSNLTIKDVVTSKRVCSAWQEAIESYLLGKFKNSGIKQIVRGYTHTYFVHHNGEVSVLGTTKLKAPKERTYQPFLGLTNVRQIFNSTMTFFAVLTNDSVMSWGNNFDAQLGLGFKNDRVEHPNTIFRLKNVKTIAAASQFTLALKNDGTVWFWGRLGHGTHTEPTPLNEFKNIQEIAAGTDYYLVLDQNGEVLIHCGVSEHPLLNILAQPGQSPCRKIPGILQPRYLRPSSEHLFFMTTAGTVLGWGVNRYGELGLDPKSNVISTPTTLDTPLPAVQEIAVGQWHGIALHTDGTISTWGANDQKQLGYEVSQTTQPRKIPNINNVRLVAASSDNCMILQNDGTILSWGDNRHGELGFGDDIISSPTQIFQPNLVITKQAIARRAPKTNWLLLEESQQALLKILDTFITPIGFRFFAATNVDAEQLSLAKGLREFIEAKPYYLSIINEIKIYRELNMTRITNSQEKFVAMLNELKLILESAKELYINEAPCEHLGLRPVI